MGQIALLMDKMETEEAKPIRYFWNVGDGQFYVNDLLGKKIKIFHTGHLYCIKCGRKSNRLFGQGFCYPCFTNAPEAEECLLHPELCRAHEGLARDMEYAKKHCLIDHYIYLAASDQLKVGVTRSTQIPTRWIDQGASSAVIVARTPNRNTAGCMEVELKKYFPDKTNWRSMLTNKVMENPDFNAAIDRLPLLLPVEWHTYLLDNQVVTSLHYPVLEYPSKVVSIDLQKTPEISGRLMGIKGQYLILANGQALNIRKHSGFEVVVEVQS